MDSVKQQLRELIDRMAAMQVEITDEFVAEISNDCQQEIESLKSTGVSITVGM